MKQIIIFLLIVILAVIGYGQYKQYKRFSLESYEYKSSKDIDMDYPDENIVYSYYEAIEDVNGFVITQWSTNNIDVRNPKRDNDITNSAVKEYAKKLSKVKYYEALLERSKNLKDQGLSNSDITLMKQTGMTHAAHKNNIARTKLMAMYNGQKNLILGESNAFVYEIQKLLVKNGYDIPLDGVYKTITSNAIKDFESKNKLFADGKLDQITLEALLN